MAKIYDFFTGFANRDRDGVTKERAEKEKNLNFTNFFKLMGRKFGSISAANLLFSLCNIWIIAVLLGTSGNFDAYTTTPVNPLYAQLYGFMGYENGGFAAMADGFLGVTSSLKIVSATSIVLVCFAFLSILTFGTSSVGMFYLIRAAVRSDYVSNTSDFFSAIKRNLKQALIFGIIDIALIIVLAYDFLAYQVNSSFGFFYQISFYLIIAVMLIYTIMRGYIYTLMITFDLPLGKIFKNAFLLTALGIKRNLLALIGMALVIALNAVFLIFLQGIGFLLPFMITVSLCAFISVYAAWPVVEKYMIKPYYESHPEEAPTDSEEEAEPVEKPKAVDSYTPTNTKGDFL